jgi:hypothetical protein
MSDKVVPFEKFQQRQSEREVKHCAKYKTTTGYLCDECDSYFDLHDELARCHASPPRPLPSPDPERAQLERDSSVQINGLMVRFVDDILGLSDPIEATPELIALAQAYITAFVMKKGTPPPDGHHPMPAFGVGMEIWSMEDDGAGA